MSVSGYRLEDVVVDTADEAEEEDAGGRDPHSEALRAARTEGCYRGIALVDEHCLDNEQLPIVNSGNKIPLIAKFRLIYLSKNNP